MENTYVTIKQASKLTGKHPDTIRNLMRKNRDTTNITKDDNGRVLISTNLLNITYPKTTHKPLEQLDIEKEVNRLASEKKAQQEASEQLKIDISGNDSIIQALINELDAKNKLIADQQETIRKIVDQQQQLSGLLLQTKNNPNENNQPLKNTKKRLGWFSRKK